MWSLLSNFFDLENQVKFQVLATFDVFRENSLPVVYTNLFKYFYFFIGGFFESYVEDISAVNVKYFLLQLVRG